MLIKNIFYSRPVQPLANLCGVHPAVQRLCRGTSTWRQPGECPDGAALPGRLSRGTGGLSTRLCSGSTQPVASPKREKCQQVCLIGVRDAVDMGPGRQVSNNGKWRGKKRSQSSLWGKRRKVAPGRLPQAPAPPGRGTMANSRPS